MSLVAATAAAAKERATFLTGQYATAEQCAKLRKIEAGGPKTVETAPELLDADGFHGWEDGCGFVKIFEHEPDTSWLALMICSEGMTVNAANYVFTKVEDTIEVYGPHADGEGPEIFTPCEPKKGN